MAVDEKAMKSSEEVVEEGLFHSNLKMRGLGLVARVRAQHSRVNEREKGLMRSKGLLILRNSCAPVLKGVRA